MTVTAQPTALPIQLDLAPAAAGTGQPTAEMFGGLIAALAASGVQAAGFQPAGSADPALPGEAPVLPQDAILPATDAEPTVAAEQLLALSCAMPARAQLMVRKPGQTADAPGTEVEGGGEAEPDRAGCEIETPTLLTSPTAMLTPVAAILPAPVSAQPAKPAEVVADRTGAKVVQPDVQLPSPALETGTKAAQPAPEILKLLQPQAPEPVRDAIRSVLAQALPGAIRPKAEKAAAEPAPLAPELKPVAASFTLTPFAAPEPAVRADVPVEAAQIAAPDMAELIVERQLDMVTGDEWLDDLARDIARTAGNDGAPLRFRLNPENLGSLRVEIAANEGGTAVRLTADTEAARAIIADAQPRLLAEARAQGLRISEAHVDLGQQPGSDANKRHADQSQEPQIRTARTLREDGEHDGKPTPSGSERYA